MTTDALLALRPYEVVPEEAIRECLHAVQVELELLDSAVLQAEADADEAERRLGREDMSDEAAEQFTRGLRQSLERLVATTERELRDALDEARRVAESRVARARAQAGILGERPRPAADPVGPGRSIPPSLAVEDQISIEHREPYLELRAIVSKLLDPAAPEPQPVSAAPAVDSAPLREGAGASQSNRRDVLASVVLPILAAALFLVTVLLLLR